MLPEHYPSSDHLPFNSSCLAGRFQPESPDRASGGAGVWLLLRGGELLVEATGALPRGIAPPVPLPDGRTPLHIGRWDGSPCRVLALPKELGIPSGLHGENLSAVEPQLPIELLTLGGIAGQILHWQRTSRHCPRCGGATIAVSGSWGRACGACGYEHFPHIHPCVIVVIRRPGELLLARKAGWPVGRYGLVAGFLDFGESLEEAVVREVREETGVEVTDVRYVGSQCWPFPSQLMAGFTAAYAGGEIRVDTTELEDARWFSLDALPNLPPKRSIARFLIDQHS
ncbi:MAG: NADH pyrophosphatase, partial [Desulfuromonadales bacterium GWD2_61_12]